jgi:oligosaccharide repeat unit polymerase
MTAVLLSIYLFVPLIILLSSWLEKPKKDLLDVRIFLAFLFFLGGVFRPLYLINTGEYVPDRYSLDDKSWFLAISACAISFIFLTIGFKASRRLSIFNLKSALDSEKFDRIIVWLCIGVFALAGSYGAYTKLVHAQSFIFSEIAIRGDSPIRPSGYFTLLRSLLYVAIGLAYWDILQFPKKCRYLRIVALAILVVIAVTQPILVGSRGQVLNILFMLIVPFHYLIKKITISKAIVLGVLMTTMVVFLGATRGNSVDVTNVNLANSHYSDFLLRSHRFFDLVSIGKTIEKVPEEVDHLYGSSLARFFVVPIPREVWSDKPISLGQIVGAEIYGVGIGVIGGGVPPTIVGELYFNFNLVGVIVGMLLFGVLTRFVYSLVNGTRRTPARVIIYAFSLMGIAGIFMGAFTLGLLGALLQIIPFYLVLKLASFRSEKQKLLVSR